MLLGKRPRGPMRRTTSMTGINVDLGHVEGSEPSDPSQDSMMNREGALEAPLELQARRHVVVGGSGGLDHHLMATVSPRYHRTTSPGGGGGIGGNNMVMHETAHFLRTCGLCKRRLAPGRDIYMYRGDTAFCSLECREQQMKHDERKEKCSIAASKKDENQQHQHQQQHHHRRSPTTTSTEA